MLTGNYPRQRATRPYVTHPSAVLLQDPRLQTHRGFDQTGADATGQFENHAQEGGRSDHCTGRRASSHGARIQRIGSREKNMYDAPLKNAASQHTCEISELLSSSQQLRATGNPPPPMLSVRIEARCISSRTGLFRRWCVACRMPGVIQARCSEKKRVSLLNGMRFTRS